MFQIRVNDNVYKNTLVEDVIRINLYNFIFRNREIKYMIRILTIMRDDRENIQLQSQLDI